ncbi:type 1 glutamine amidotransferase [Pseudomonas sp. NCCP-436]|uniref:type 1 glutamine amidotransferase n=1 Tax=Pseudomonas sp. NCCP-436 TaxID=2842481 RepID=UPI001C825A5F|nr:type 1 glutamine amidotransferase [Pseudomonas sp. NCCP-436]GIZ12679.1 GMP synthase [Pseudomonas sp. NCCP-436]
MRVAVIQHSKAAGPAALERWLEEHEVSRYRPYAGSELPDLDDFRVLILLDASLSVHDEREHAWLAEEKRLIHRALMTRKRIFGTGFGAHLLAEALGARVGSCADGVHIGWWQLEKNPQSRLSPLGRMLPQRLLALHWQREACSLPHGAIALYGSPAGPLQGFVWQERAIGLLCQLEVDAAGLDERLRLNSADLDLPGQVQDLASIRDAAPHSSSASATLRRVLDYLSGGHAHMT